jgi:hypothetical protein
MSRGMFGDVKKQSENRRRQFFATDETIIEERFHRNRAACRKRDLNSPDGISDKRFSVFDV